MTVDAIAKKVQELLGFEEAGFVEHKNYDRNYYMLKETNDLSYYIWYEFFPKAGTSELGFNWISYWIICPKVNQILAQVLNRVDYRFPAGARIMADLHDSTLQDIKENHDLLHEFIANNRTLPFIEEGNYYEGRLKEGCSVWKQCIEQFAFPFFAKFSTLQQVNDEIINVIQWSDLHTRIPYLSAFKRLVIMKLCNNPAYVEFAVMFEQRIKNVLQQGNTEYQSYYDALIALLDYLDNGQYVYAENEFPQPEKTAQVLVAKKTTLPSLPPNYALETQFTLQKNVLESLGILFDSRFSLNDFRNDMNFQSWGMETKEGKDLQYYLLLLAGTYVLDPNTDTYAPASPNVYYFDAEWDGFVNYGTILQRLNLLTGNALPFEAITGHFDEFIGVSFRYKGEEYKWEYEYYDDWTDMRIFNQFIQLVTTDLINNFYILPEGQGGLIFYFSAKQKQLFEQNSPDKQLIKLDEYR